MKPNLLQAIQNDPDIPSHVAAQLETILAGSVS